MFKWFEWLLNFLIIQSYKSLLDVALAEHFPELAPHLEDGPTAMLNVDNAPLMTNGKVESKG